MALEPLRSANHVLWGGERRCSSIPATSRLVLVPRRNGTLRGFAVLVIGYPYAWRTGRTLAFAFAVISGRGEVHLATSSSSPVLATLSAPRRLEHDIGALKTFARGVHTLRVRL